MGSCHLLPAQGVREDLKDSLLEYKRKDLAAMMSGRQVPPSFGLLLFTDIDRWVGFRSEWHQVPWGWSGLQWT